MRALKSLRENRKICTSAAEGELILQRLRRG